MWTIVTINQQRSRLSPSTPFPLSEVLLERAMRLNTDGKGALLGKSMGIEIGGAHDGRNST